MTNTSVGRGPASGGNENHDGDPRHTTLGEAVEQEPPAGSQSQPPATAAPGEDRPPAPGAKVPAAGR